MKRICCICYLLCFLSVSVFANAQNTPPVVNFSPTSLSIVEGQNELTCVDVVKNGSAIPSNGTALRVNMSPAAVFGTRLTSPDSAVIPPSDTRARYDGLRGEVCVTAPDDDIVSERIVGNLSLGASTETPVTYTVGTNGNLQITIDDDDIAYLQMNTDADAKTFSVTAHKQTSKAYQVTWNVTAAAGSMLQLGEDGVQSGPLNFTGKETDRERETKLLSVNYECKPLDTEENPLPIPFPWVEVKFDTSTATASGLDVRPSRDAWYVCGTKPSLTLNSPDGNAQASFDASGSLTIVGQSQYACEPQHVQVFGDDGESTSSWLCNWVKDSTDTDSTDTDSTDTDSTDTDSTDTDSTDTDSTDTDSTDTDSEFATDSELSGGCSISSSERNHVKDALSTFAVFGIVLISGYGISRNIKTK